MSLPETSAVPPASQRTWPLALLFGVVNSLYILALTAAGDLLEHRGKPVWLMTLEDTPAGPLLACLFLLVQPIAGMILMNRGHRRLGKALTLSLVWTVVVCALGMALLVAWLIYKGRLFG